MKLMIRFIENEGGHNTRDVILLAEAWKFKEKYSDMCQVFGPTANELRKYFYSKYERLYIC